MIPIQEPGKPPFHVQRTTGAAWVTSIRVGSCAPHVLTGRRSNSSLGGQLGRRAANEKLWRVSKRVDADEPSSPRAETAIDDSQLVGSALAGDSAAYDELVRRYQRRAVAVAYRLLGNIHDAADVSQDAFLRAYRGLGSLEDHDRFGPWLLRIVSNLSLNYRRSRQTGTARSAVSLDDVGERAGDFRSPSGESLPGGALGELATGSPLSAELRGRISAAIGELPEKQRLALILYGVEGLPQKEVAQIMECSLELVKWNVFTARKTLRKSLAAYLE